MLGWFVGVGQLRKEPRLTRVEAFRLGPVEPTQQLVEALLQPFALALLLLERVEQFRNHGLQRRDVVRQGRREMAGGGFNSDNGNVRAHAGLDARAGWRVREKAKKTEEK